MANRNTEQFFQVLLICFFFVACAGSRKPDSRPATSDRVQGFENMREDFNPADLDDDDIEIESSAPNKAAGQDAGDAPMTTLQDSIGNGYRVQIIQTTDPEEAKNVQRDALLRFNYDVYRVFNPPFYKIRVGDFINWRDAEKVQVLAIQRGFRDAWVIRTKINLNKLYDEVN